MGQLKPGATYIYERANGVTYARESGADPSTRFAIGWDHDPNRPGDGSKTYANAREARLWKSIRETAKTNPALQRVLDRAILIHNLVKKNEQ